MTSAIVQYLYPHNFFCHHLFIGTKGVFISQNSSIATFWKWVYLCTVKPALSSHPQKMGFHRIRVILKWWKMSFYAIVDFMYKNSLKILLTLVLGEKNGFNFTKKIILSFNWVVLPYMWPFITSRRQYKQAVVTHSKVTMTT